MIEIAFNNHKYNLPTRWEDLTNEQFIYVSSLLTSFNAGLIDLISMRALMACHFLGLNDRFVHRASKNERFNENIYRIGNELRFFYKYEYTNVNSFNRIPKTTRDILKRYHPDELGDSTHTRWARKAGKRMMLDFTFAKQQLPVISKRRTKLAGYSFELDGQLLHTNLSARQFANALSIYNQYAYSKQNNDVLLNKLVATLYCNPYKADEAKALESKVAALPLPTRQAVAFNFMAVQNFLFSIPKYKVLFRSDKTDNTKKDTLGFGGAIISMVKKGYGSLKEMNDTNLLEFFESMYSDLISTIQQMKEMDMDVVDIAKKTGLSVKTINELT